MTTITITTNNDKHTKLLVSLAERLQAHVIVNDTKNPSVKSDVHQTLILKFKADCKKYKALVPNPQNALKLFKKIISQLSNETLAELVFSLTDSESIYFRFPLGDSLSRAHLEVFYSMDNDMDEIEAVVNIYHKDKIVAKNYGSLEKAIEIINDNYYDHTPDFDLKPSSFEIKKTGRFRQT
ncbi:MAG: hypothetical protein KDD27_28050 [Saprospiraceae bacterium]|nr:hypothetical protein [Saprospiraceae bacterium]